MGKIAKKIHKKKPFFYDKKVPKFSLAPPKKLNQIQLKICMLSTPNITWTIHEKCVY
jgi:hypothetical protein